MRAGALSPAVLDWRSCGRRGVRHHPRRLGFGWAGDRRALAAPQQLRTKSSAASKKCTSCGEKTTPSWRSGAEGGGRTHLDLRGGGDPWRLRRRRAGRDGVEDDLAAPADKREAARAPQREPPCAARNARPHPGVRDSLPPGRHATGVHVSPGGGWRFRTIHSLAYWRQGGTWRRRRRRGGGARRGQRPAGRARRRRGGVGWWQGRWP